MPTKAELAAAAKETAAAIEQAKADVNGANTALALAPGGVYAISQMTDEAFEGRLAAMKVGLARVKRVQKEYMDEGIDYGTIEGIDKPTLFKPGAEKLMQLYGLAARLDSAFVPGDNETTPPITYDTQCFLHVGNFDGPIVGVGHGTANSWEKRYRREGQKTCPNCGNTTVIKGKAEYGGGWVCWKKKGGCGTTYQDNDPAILSQTANASDITAAYDLGVTLMKMSEKRSITDAVLRATATSGLFTQDVADEALPDVPAQQPQYADSAYGDPDPEVRVTQDAPTTAQSDELGPVTIPDEGYTEQTLDQVAAVSGGEVVEIGPATAENVERGGHTPGANEAQIAEVRRLAGELKWGSKSLLAYVYAKFEAVEPDVPEDGRVARGELTAYLEKMDSLSAAALVTALAEDLRIQQEAEAKDAG